MDHQGKVTRQGQITIPKELRERYSISEGDTIAYADLGDHIIILPHPKEAIKTLLSFKVKTTESIQKIKQRIHNTAIASSGGV